MIRICVTADDCENFPEIRLDQLCDEYVKPPRVTSSQCPKTVPSKYRHGQEYESQTAAEILQVDFSRRMLRQPPEERKRLRKADHRQEARHDRVCIAKDTVFVRLVNGLKWPPSFRKNSR